MAEWQFLPLLISLGKFTFLLPRAFFMNGYNFLTGLCHWNYNKCDVLTTYNVNLIIPRVDIFLVETIGECPTVNV